MSQPAGDSFEVPSLEEIADRVGVYSVEAFYFVRQGLNFTAKQIHGTIQTDDKHHVSGQQLAEGLRDLALHQWGLMARVVLERWGIHSSLDMGRIVYAMIEHGVMAKTDEDNLDDFKGVFDFNTAFEPSHYHISSRVLCK